MKHKTIDSLFSDYKMSNTNKNKRLTSSERKSVKLARSIRKDKHKWSNELYA